MFSPNPSVGNLYAKVAAKFGMNVDAEKMEQLFREEFSKRDKEAALKAHSTEKNEKEWWRKLVFDIFSKVTNLRSFDQFFEELYDLFASHEAWRLYADVVPTLEELKKRNCTLGIVSNWDSRLFSICEGMGINHYFDFILASAVVGWAKPNPKIFEEALLRARAKPENAVHIGDSLENDVLGAKNAGVDSFLILRNGKSIETANVIHSLQELV